ncbi:hypothetical protein ACF5W4_06940 [Bacillota bacterium Lsc_1132]
MTTFLLLISLLLNGIAIFSIIVLFTRQSRFLEVEKKQEKMMKDMEEVISSYLYEMKEENEAFLRKFQAANSPKNSKQDSLSAMPETKSISSKKAEHEPVGERKGKTASAFKKQAAQAYQNSFLEKKENESKVLVSEQDSFNALASKNAEEMAGKTASNSSPEEIYRDLFVNQVIMLQKQGLTNEEIAKKLNKGKTEIELLLKFAQNH